LANHAELGKKVLLLVKPKLPSSATMFPHVIVICFCNSPTFSIAIETCFVSLNLRWWSVQWSATCFAFGIWSGPEIVAINGRTRLRAELAVASSDIDAPSFEFIITDLAVSLYKHLAYLHHFFIFDGGRPN
jgi:hypothetical protein